MPNHKGRKGEVSSCSEKVSEFEIYAHLLSGRMGDNLKSNSGDVEPEAKVTLSCCPA